MKRIICVVIAILLLSTTGFASTYSDKKAYLVANGYLWYANGDDVQRVDTVYSQSHVLRTKNGAIVYLNNSKKAILIENVNRPESKSQIASSISIINTNSEGYAVSVAKGSYSAKVKIDDDRKNDEVTVYIAKQNKLYSLEPDNSLTELKSLKSVTNSGNSSNNNLCIGFSKWGDLVFINYYGVCFFNERIGRTDKIELLKNERGYSVQAKYFNSSDGIITSVMLQNGRTEQLIND